MLLPLVEFFFHSFVSDNYLLGLLPLLFIRSYTRPSGNSDAGSSNASRLSEGTVRDLVSNNSLEDLKSQQGDNAEARDLVKSELDDAILKKIANISKIYIMS